MKMAENTGIVQIQALNYIIRSKTLDFVFDNDLTEKHFSDYQEEFNFIVDHYKQYGNVPDEVTFFDKFREMDNIAVSETEEYLVDKLNEEFMFRELIPITHKFNEMATSGNAREARDYLLTALSEVEQSYSNIGISIVHEGAEMRLEEYNQKKNATEPWMRPTGFKELDDEIGGLSPGEEFVVIVARTNNGKSWVLAKILEHNFNLGFRVGYISPEMSANQIGYRFDTLYEHFSNFALYAGRDTEDDYEAYIKKLNETSNGDFIVATPLEFNKKITVTKLRKFCLKHKLDMLGIDGITYITDERYKKGDNKTTSLTNISEDLMSLSCELKIPIIAVVQANRSGVDEDGGVPSLESIRDSDGISHNASKVLSIRQHNNKLKMEVTKARNCKVGTKLVYDWQIDVGKFEFNPGGDDDYNSDENLESRRPNRKEPVENKQPLVNRRGSNQNPF